MFATLRSTWQYITNRIATLFSYIWQYIKNRIETLFACWTGTGGTNEDSSYPIVHASMAVFVFSGLVATGAGLKHLHYYYDLHRIPFGNLDISLYEIIYKPTILLYHEANIEYWGFFLLCIFMTIFAIKPFWGERRFNLLIISCVPALWLLFGGKLSNYHSEIAKGRFVWDVIKRDRQYPRVNIDLKNIKKDSNHEIMDYLKNGCYYLIAQDKKTVYLMFDPSIDGKFYNSTMLSDENFQSIEKDCEEQIDASQAGFSSINDQKEANTNFQYCFEKKKSEQIQKYYEYLMEPGKLHMLVMEISQTIKTAQIPTDSLSALYTLPLGAPLNPDCKVKAQPKQAPAPTQKAPITPCPPCPDYESPCTCSQ